MISSRLTRLQIGKSSLRCITALCLPTAATAPQAETLIFYSPREEKYLRAGPGTEVSPLLLFISWKSLRRGVVGDSSSSALGGTVAVVSPALSRPSSANESAAGSAGREEGEDFCGPAAPPPLAPPTTLPLPFRAKWKAVSGYSTTSNHSVYPENDPGSELGNTGRLLLQFRWG